MAPSSQAPVPGRSTISDSSYSNTAPKPLQLEHAPRGLLKEKSAGVTVTAGVSQTTAGRELGESVTSGYCRVLRESQRHGDPFSLAKGSGDRLAQRPREAAPPPAGRPRPGARRPRSGPARGAARPDGVPAPSASTRTKPSARRFSTTAAWVSRATGGRGKHDLKSGSAQPARMSSAAASGVSRRTGPPQFRQ